MKKGKMFFVLLAAALSCTACSNGKNEVPTDVVGAEEEADTAENADETEETEETDSSDDIEEAADNTNDTEETNEVDSTEDTEVSDSADDTEGKEAVTDSENTEGSSYMEKYADLITQLPPKEITEKRSGVEYPQFQKYTYYSQTAERDTPVNVLLPKDYSEEKEYPVLYILHGFYDNEDWMARDIVGISTMLTNLYDDGEAEEMIVVLPYIFCNKDMPRCTGMDLQNCISYDNFIYDLTTDLMPFIEDSFSVAVGRENTAITGFSMGGRESLFIGFSHPELFGYIGGVCPAPGLIPIQNSPMHPGQMEKEDMKFAENAPYLMMISASKSDGVVGGTPSDYHNILEENNVEHIWHLLDSTGHDHSSVRPHLYNYLRTIFRGQE